MSKALFPVSVGSHRDLEDKKDGSLDELGSKREESRKEKVVRR
jgi:hypothetical protein